MLRLVWRGALLTGGAGGAAYVYAEHVAPPSSSLAHDDRLTERLLRQVRGVGVAVTVMLDYKISLRGLKRPAKGVLAAPPPPDPDRKHSPVDRDPMVQSTREAASAGLPHQEQAEEQDDERRHAMEYMRVLKEVHQRSADRLLALCARHRGLYTKLGQYLASLKPMLPPEYTDTLRVLQDKNPFQPLFGPHGLHHTLREELGEHWETELFEEFDETPVAAASLAQVHRARLKPPPGQEHERGEEVAVKIQYPFLRRQVVEDVSVMKRVAWLVGKLFPDFSYMWMFPEFEETIMQELDFLQEGVNAERVRNMYQGRSDIYVPEIRWDLSSRRVLCMEFVHACKISEVDKVKAAGLDPKLVGRAMAEAFGEMIFFHGFVHCDPHPGNLLVRPNPVRAKDRNAPAHQVVLLDHGMYRRLDPAFRRSYCRLWEAFVLRDTEMGRDACQELNIPRKDFDALSLIMTYRPNMNSAMGQSLSAEDRQQIREQYKGTTVQQVNEFLERLPRDLLFLFRCMTLVRSVNLDLGASTRQRLQILGQCAIHGLQLTELCDQLLGDTALIPSHDIAEQMKMEDGMGAVALSECASLRARLEHAEDVRDPMQVAERYGLAPLGYSADDLQRMSMPMRQPATSPWRHVARPFANINKPSESELVQKVMGAKLSTPADVLGWRRIWNIKLRLAAVDTLFWLSDSLAANRGSSFSSWMSYLSSWARWFHFSR